MSERHSPYAQFLAYTSSFFGDSRAAFHRRVPFLPSDRFAALDRAYRTVPIAARFLDRGEQQWNPFHQRLLVHEMAGAGWRSAEPFARDYTASIAIAESVHELVHILLWEPFFCGHERIRSRGQFSELSLIFEAYCYFFGEEFTRTIGLRYRDRRPVFHDASSLSSPDYHPFVVMRAEGVRASTDILEQFSLAIRGYDSRVNRFHTPLGLRLRNSLYSFYRENAVAVVRHYDLARKMGLFHRFWKDFCRDVRGREGLAAYNVGSFGYAAIQRDPQRVAAISRLLAAPRRDEARRLAWIRRRRRLQTRAYYLLSDLHLARDGVMIDQRRKHAVGLAERRAFVAELEERYQRLHEVWRAFIADPTRDIERTTLPLVDRAIDRVYRARRHLHVGARLQIFPVEGLPKHQRDPWPLRQSFADERFNENNFVYR